MKILGLVGGISWASTLDYYRYINQGINEELGGLNFSECLIYSVNFNNFQKYNSEYDWDSTFELLANAAENLKKAGAEGIVLCANTAHIVADRVAERVQLPLIHIIEVTAKAIHQKKLKKVGLLGTIYTMELDFYKDKLHDNGIEPIIPEMQSDRNFIEESLRRELGRGVLNPKTKSTYLSIIQQFVA
ncbi:MAG: amino acid racemase, partial [Ginsengibacter sp.]